jgi:hypothetical protein
MHMFNKIDWELYTLTNVKKKKRISTLTFKLGGGGLFWPKNPFLTHFSPKKPFN